MSTNIELQAQINEMQSTLDLLWAADQRGIKMWQEAHPGNDLVWPDRGKMIFWLLEELGSAKAQIEELLISLGAEPQGEL